MKLYTYGGETPSEALKKAQSIHGDEALVIENKEIRKKSLTSPGLYEVVVAAKKEVEAPISAPTVKKSNSIQERLDEIAKRELERKKAQKKLEIFEDNISAQLSNAVREISQISNDMNLENDTALLQLSPKSNGHLSSAYMDSVQINNENIKAQSIDVVNKTMDLNKRVDFKLQDKSTKNTNQSDELKGIKQELDKVNDKLKLIQNMVWDDKSPKSEGINIPHEFAEIYRIAKNSGISKEHLDSVMSLSLELMPLRMRENSLTIKRYFREVLRKMIYCRAESRDNSKKIIMLVGPTGVGKTTALAKLAARFSLEKKARVGIITLDSYRIGALEQLQWYADRMKISIQMVMAPEDFLKALDSLRHCDYILIDTAGRSQNDNDRIVQIKKYLQGDYKISTSLVMSATTKLDDLRDIYDAFNVLNLDTLIFSKLDESRGLGNIFSLAYEIKKPISYFSIGQEVPTDLLVATNDALVDWLIDGFINPNK